MPLPLIPIIAALGGAVITLGAGLYTGIVGSNTYIETVVQEAAGWETYILVGGLIISLVILGYAILSKPKPKSR